jgi:predicted nucleic acid-binding Zn ribbon protein
MLVSVNEVSERLKISTRAVQIKCKRAKLKKIGNRYQITEEIANVWYNAENQPLTPTNEPERTQNEQKCLQLLRKHPLQAKKRVRLFRLLLYSLLILLVSVSVLFYINLDDQIQKQKPH